MISLKYERDSARPENGAADPVAAFDASDPGSALRPERDWQRVWKPAVVGLACAKLRRMRETMRNPVATRGTPEDLADRGDHSETTGQECRALAISRRMDEINLEASGQCRIGIQVGGLSNWMGPGCKCGGCR